MNGGRGSVAKVSDFFTKKTKSKKKKNEGMGGRWLG